MQYRVFMSHSSKDDEVVKYSASRLQHFGIESIIAQYVRPESFPEYLPDKIKKLIHQSDCTVAFITKNGITSNWVHQEIGYALDKKPLIPFVEDGIPLENLGFLQGAEYIPLHWGKIEQSVDRLVSWAACLKTEKEKNRILIGVAMIILGGLSMWWLSKQE